MPATPLAKFGRYALWFSPVVIAIVGFFATLPWLKQQNDTFALALSVAVAIFVMGYAHLISRKLQLRMDEVHVASQGFAISHGWTWGTTTAVLLLSAPPVANGLIDLASTMSTGSPDMSDRGAARLALFYGFLLVVFVQPIAVIGASVIWWRRMERT